MTTVADGHHTLPSTYLIKDMPRRVLFGKAAVIEKWCRENGKAVPTLLDLACARKAVDMVNNQSNKRGRGKKQWGQKRAG